MFFDGIGWRHLRIAYDGQALIAEYNASNALLRRYVHGPGTDEPIVWYEGTGTADRRWLHADERGSIIAITNASGTLLSTNRYDEYGIPASTNAGRFQYTGQTWLPEPGMFYYKARIYSPTLGRFMQTDPIGYQDGLNWYAYVGNDPINGKDPMGLQVVGDIVVSHKRIEDRLPSGYFLNLSQLRMALPSLSQEKETKTILSLIIKLCRKGRTVYVRLAMRW